MALDVYNWIECAPEKILESGFLSLVRQSGVTINFNGGAYLANEPIFHPWTGGVMWVDWAVGNIQETPLVVEKYYQDLKKDYVWWSDVRHEPIGFEQQLKWMGLLPVEPMVALSFDMANYRAHESPKKFDIFMMEEPSDKEDFCHLFKKCFDYSDDFKKEAIAYFKRYTFNERIIHQIGYYRGHPVCMGSFYACLDHAFILNIGTDPKHRGNGFGTLMLEDLLASAYVLKLRRVFVIATAQEAPFFLARGFEKKFDFNLYASEGVFKRWPKAGKAI
jgi:ribosomal protein S18 acetylase RimI-like enzyme